MHLQRPLKSQSLHNMLAEKLSSPWVHPRFKGGARKHQSQKNKNRAELITKDSSCRVKNVARVELRLLLSTLPKLLTSRYTLTPPPSQARAESLLDWEARRWKIGLRRTIKARHAHGEQHTLTRSRYTRTDVSDTWHARGSSQGFPLKHAHTRLFTLARYTRPHTRLRHALCYDKQGPSSVCVRDTGAIGGVGDTEEEEKAWWGNYFSDYFSLTATLKICFFLNYWSPAAINETNRGTILEFHTAWHHLNTTWRKWYQAGVDGGVRTTPVRLGGKQWFR